MPDSPSSTSAHSVAGAPPDHSTGVECVVRRYFAVVSDLASTEQELTRLLDPGIRVVEHPNLVTPSGARRGFDDTLTGFRAGKSLLRTQEFVVHEVFATGERAAVRATWQGVVGVDAGPYRAGQQLIAQVAALLTVREGRVVEHETFDCYQPFGSTDDHLVE